MNYTEYALIVAGGKGSRIKSDVPKQFLKLNGLPVLMHTIEAFYRYSEKIKVIVVLPERDFNTWKSLCAEFNFNKAIILQNGGDSRFQSVKLGLENIPEDGLVAIHDGVRPLVTEEIIGTSFRLAAVHQSAVAAIHLKESIRMVNQYNTSAMDRSQFRIVQTPQTFEAAFIKKAYEQKEDTSLTDDASIAERAGLTISLFEGSYENIKITTAEDLIIAEALMKNRQNRSLV